MSGSLHSKKIRKALGIRNWESAQKIVRDWEARVGGDSVNVALAFERFIADCEARNLRAESIAKYRLLQREMAAQFGVRPVDGVSLHDLSEYRESWDLAPIFSSKKIERLRTFFRFCMERGWTEKNPATALKAPKASFLPTLPFTDEELGKVMAAVEVYPDRPTGRRAQLRAFILVLRYAGLRIGEAVSISVRNISDGTVFLRTAKTGTPVRCPVPQHVEDSVKTFCEVNQEFPFFSGNCKVKSAVADWQRTLSRLFKIAGVESGFAHRFRDTAAVNWLSHGVSIEDVAILLGHQSIRVTEKHSAPFVKVRQDRLETAVRVTLDDNP